MTLNRPEEDARCAFMNGADRPVDIYVNYHDEAYATVKPEEDQSVFSIDSEADRLYGTYTFDAREKDEPGGDVLASASVEFEEGDSYTAVFHPAGSDEYRLSVYDSDFSPSAASRFELHHNGYPERVDWTLAPKAEADPRIPVDERSGTLERGQWQRAIDVTENEYRLEILVDGEVVAYRPDLELEQERMIACYFVGDPKPGMGSDEKQAHIFRQEYQIPTGPEREDETTSPAGPLSTADDNQPIEFDVDPPELYETNSHEIAIEATDPDGIVDWLALDSVEPDVDGFRIRDDSVGRSTGIGEPATATLQMSSNVPAGSYDVRVVANPEGLGERATRTLALEVESITVERLWNRVEHHHGNGAVTDEVADDLFALLRDAGASPDEGPIDGLLDAVDSLFDSGDQSAADESTDPRKPLADVVALVTERQGDGIHEAASEDIETETEALLERLDGE